MAVQLPAAAAHTCAVRLATGHMHSARLHAVGYALHCALRARLVHQRTRLVWCGWLCGRSTELFTNLLQRETSFFDSTDVGSLTSRLQADCQVRANGAAAAIPWCHATKSALRGRRHHAMERRAGSASFACGRATMTCQGGGLPCLLECIGGGGDACMLRVCKPPSGGAGGRMHDHHRMLACMHAWMAPSAAAYAPCSCRP